MIEELENSEFGMRNSELIAVKGNYIISKSDSNSEFIIHNSEFVNRCPLDKGKWRIPRRKGLTKLIIQLSDVKQ